MKIEVNGEAIPPPIVDFKQFIADKTCTCKLEINKCASHINLTLLFHSMFSASESYRFGHSGSNSGSNASNSLCLFPERHACLC